MSQNGLTRETSAAVIHEMDLRRSTAKEGDA